MLVSGFIFLLALFMTLFPGAVNMNFIYQYALARMAWNELKLPLLIASPRYVLSIEVHLWIVLSCRPSQTPFTRFFYWCFPWTHFSKALGDVMLGTDGQ